LNPNSCLSHHHFQTIPSQQLIIIPFRQPLETFDFKLISSSLDYVANILHLLKVIYSKLKIISLVFQFAPVSLSFLFGLIYYDPKTWANFLMQSYLNLLIHLHIISFRAYHFIAFVHLVHQSLHLDIDLAMELHFVPFMKFQVV
jgi:hypothetical protein